MKKIVFTVVLLFGAIITHGQDIKRVACVGDSITFGYGIKKRQYNAYPAQLAKKLGKEYQVRNFGVSSSTLLNKGNKPYTKLKTYKNALSFNPNIVVIKLGTNDTKPGNWKYNSEYVADYVSLIQSFQKLESKPQVFICTPVPVYQTKSGINEKTIVEGIIPKVIEIAQKTNCESIDLHTALSNKPEMFPDKIHPNKDGVGLIADAVYSAITGKKFAAQEQKHGLFPGKKKSFHGFDMYDDGATRIVVPKQIADGKPWVWRARFWGHQPQFDIAMLKRGYHVVYCNVGDLFGSPKAVERWNEFYHTLRSEHGFAERPVLEGMSRGGLIIYNWAAANPEKVAAIYGDNPVMDFKSWPGGKGISKGEPKSWEVCLNAYGLSEQEAMEFPYNPVDHLESLAKAGIPIIHVIGDKDRTVPVAENSRLAEERYKSLGGIFKVINKPNAGHHPHSLKDPAPIVDFVIKHSISDKENPEGLLKKSQRILFLGDSITQSGTYVVNFEAWLVKRYPDLRFTVINAGLSSETVSGLSEENHAGGRFPRPCLFERMERVLAKTNPDLIIACYGMNCGIYKELDEERTSQFRNGILRLRAVAQQYGAEVVHVTPPIYDNHGKVRLKYDSVLTTYAEWLVEQREQGWHVADLHSEMRAKVDQHRKQDPGYTVQKDRVHPNDEGHWMMAQCLIAYFGDPASAQAASAKELLDDSRLNAITQRMRSYQKAIHAETKPLRPGVRKKGSLGSAAAEAKQLEERIYLKKQPETTKVEQAAAQLQSEGPPSD